jgi:hypothetical protein
LVSRQVVSTPDDFSFAQFQDILIAIALVVFAYDCTEDGNPLADGHKVQALMVLLHQAVSDEHASGRLLEFRGVALHITAAMRIVRHARWGNNVDPVVLLTCTNPSCFTRYTQTPLLQPHPSWMYLST